MERAWWDLYGPRLTAELRYSGVGGHGEQISQDDWSLFSAADGSIGRAAFGWRSAANATPGNLGSALSTAAGSGGRAATAYKNLLHSPVQDHDGLEGRSNLGVGLAWSFSFSKSSAMRESKQIKEQSKLRAAQLEEAAVADVTIASNDLQSATKQMELAQGELTASVENRRMRLARFQSGTALVLEVIDAEESIARARLHIARYITDLNLAQARILTVSGLIDKTTFAEPVEPNANAAGH